MCPGDQIPTGGRLRLATTHRPENFFAGVSIWRRLVRRGDIGSPIGGGHNLLGGVVSVSPFSAPGTRIVHELDACDRSTAITKSLLGYLALAGPLYVLVSLAQAFTRTGFSVRRDEWSLLALGHLGWIQMTNLALTGAMIMVGAVGMRGAMGRVGADGRWAPRLVAGYGVGLVLAGLFRADPADGFPSGAPAGRAEHLSTHGMLHLLSGSVGFVCLIAACFVIARGMSRRGAHAPAVVTRLVGALFSVAFVGIASGSGTTGINLGFTAAVVIVSAWLSWMAIRLYRGVGSGAHTRGARG